MTRGQLLIVLAVSVALVVGGLVWWFGAPAMVASGFVLGVAALLSSVHSSGGGDA